MHTDDIDKASDDLRDIAKFSSNYQFFLILLNIVVWLRLYNFNDLSFLFCAQIFIVKQSHFVIKSFNIFNFYQSYIINTLSIFS